MRQLTGGWKSTKDMTPPEGEFLELITNEGKIEAVYISIMLRRSVPIYQTETGAFIPPESVEKWRLKSESIEDNKPND